MLPILGSSINLIFIKIMKVLTSSGAFYLYSCHTANTKVKDAYVSECASLYCYVCLLEYNRPKAIWTLMDKRYDEPWFIYNFVNAVYFIGRGQLFIKIYGYNFGGKLSGADSGEFLVLFLILKTINDVYAQGEHKEQKTIIWNNFYNYGLNIAFKKLLRKHVKPFTVLQSNLFMFIASLCSSSEERNA
ncbi:hypothetical protein Anas_05093 [Armadillidium nasatum]|uniref:Uncharacterized protein n=1 Tax=Armadillidium nasatum TaxID=96803 RepID=A0A5N5TCC3_9CRUS|nr:hypothetical protein Anas_05093 [Armadillidium nasatum]